MTARALLAALLFALACASSGREAPLRAGTWRGEFVLGGETFPALLRLSGPGGSLEGSMEAPGMKGTAALVVRGGVAELRGSYVAPGCRGTLRGSGEVAGGDEVRGSLQVEDSCTGASRGRFHLRLEEPGG